MGRKEVLWERYYPYAAGVIAGGMWFPLWRYLKRIPPDPESILPTAITIASISVGFLGTLAAILMASNSKVVKFLKSTNKFGVIIDFILYAIRFSFAFVLLSLVLLVFGLKHWAVTIAWLSLGAVALAATFRAIDIATVVLRSEATKRE